MAIDSQGRFCVLGMYKAFPRVLLVSEFASQGLVRESPSLKTSRSKPSSHVPRLLRAQGPEVDCICETQSKPYGVILFTLKAMHHYEKKK